MRQPNGSPGARCYFSRPGAKAMCGRYLSTGMYGKCFEYLIFNELRSLLTSSLTKESLPSRAADVVNIAFLFE